MSALLERLVHEFGPPLLSAGSRSADDSRSDPHLAEDGAFAVKERGREHGKDRVCDDAVHSVGADGNECDRGQATVRPRAAKTARAASTSSGPSATLSRVVGRVALSAVTVAPLIWSGVCQVGMAWRPAGAGLQAFGRGSAAAVVDAWCRG